MRNFDFTPFSRSSIGFDHLIDLLNNPQLAERIHDVIELHGGDALAFTQLGQVFNRTGV